MARVLRSEPLLSGLSTSTPSLRLMMSLRLIAGIGITLAGALSLAGTSWDIQWHTFVGRDRTLIPPHIIMLTGIALAGLIALSSVVLETLYMRRHPQTSQYSTRFADFFSSSLGAYVTGFAALGAAIAFPLDSYWHALYGIDVTIWAPFHIMILTGMAIIPLGAAYMLKSSVHLAAHLDDRGAIRVAHFATIIALGASMGVFTLMVPNALDSANSLVLAPGLTISFFPLLAAAVVSFVFMTAKYALPFRASATYVMLTYVALALVFSAFVPPATSALVISEGLHYRRSLGPFANLSIVAVRYWPLMPLLVAPLLDLCFAWMRRQRWSGFRLTIFPALVALLSFFPVFALQPFYGVSFVAQLGVVGLFCSLLLGLVGSFLGTQLGRSAGEVMSLEER